MSEQDDMVSISAPNTNGSGFVPGAGGLGTPGLAGIGTSRIDEPEKLGSAGSGATQLAGRAKALGKQPKEETDTAARSLDGEEWGGQLGKALGYLSAQWESQSSALSGKCQQLGQNCTSTAQAYLTADTDSANGINAAGTSSNAAAVRKDFG